MPPHRASTSATHASMEAQLGDVELDGKGAAADRRGGLRRRSIFDVGDADARAFAQHSLRQWRGRCRGRRR